MYLAAGSEWVLLLGPAVGSPGPVFVDSECVAAVVVASGSTAVGKPAVYSPTAAAESERGREKEREKGMLNNKTKRWEKREEETLRAAGWRGRERGDIHWFL